MSDEKLTMLGELGSDLLCASELRKQVNKFLFKMWDDERSGIQKKPDLTEIGYLSLQMVLLERSGEIKSHGLMSFLTSLGIPDQLWQAGYCLWAHSDHAIRSYINAKDKLLTQLAALGHSKTVPGTIVDTLMVLKRHHCEMVKYQVLAADSDFIEVMRGLKDYCDPDILAELIDQQLLLEKYGELRQQFLSSLKSDTKPLDNGQLQLVDELVAAQKLLSQSGIMVNQGQDIGDLVAHLNQESPLIVSLKNHLSQNHGIEEIVLDSADLVEEEVPVKSRISFSFLTSKAFKLPKAPILNKQADLVSTLRLTGAVAAMALLAFACLMGATSGERDFIANIEEAPVTQEFDEVQDQQLELMAFEDGDGF